jgi:glutathione S-transferase
MGSSVLYSYRRCPYAMRARMALAYSGIAVEIREISLRKKPASFLAISPKATVPVLQSDGLVIEQSYDIMKWALAKSDPDQWLSAETESLIDEWVAKNDGPFKKLLDQYKYPDKCPDIQLEETLSQAVALYLGPINERLKANPYLLGPKISLADIAIFPFVRQFAMVDPDWIDQAGLNFLKQWLNAHLESSLFLSVMQKYPTWHDPTPE